MPSTAILSPYRDTGCLSVYAGTSRESAGKVVQSVVSEFRKLKAEPVPEEELRRSKDQLKGSLMLSLESSQRAHVEPGATGNVLRSLFRLGRTDRAH